MTDHEYWDTLLQKGSKFLETPPKIKYSYVKDKVKKYHIVMDNNYISSKGSVIKSQQLTASYNKDNSRSLTSKSAICTYTWNDVNFQSHNKNNESVSTSLSFAKGQKFSNLIIYPDAIIEEEDFTSDKGIKLGIDYSNFASLPSVNLLYMLSWDVIGLEEMATFITKYSEYFNGVGQFKDIKTISDISVYPKFLGSMKDSFFRNGKFEAAYVGISTWKEHLGILFEYRCLGHLEVTDSKQNENVNSQIGSSYYFGKLLIDTNTGSLLKGDMVELITGVIINKKNKKIPQHKRRFVLLELD